MLLAQRTPTPPLPTPLFLGTHAEPSTHAHTDLQRGDLPIPDAAAQRSACNPGQSESKTINPISMHLAHEVQHELGCICHPHGQQWVLLAQVVVLDFKAAAAGCVGKKRSNKGGA